LKQHILYMQDQTFIMKLREDIISKWKSLYINRAHSKFSW